MPLYGRVRRISSSVMGLKITVPLGNRKLKGRIFRVMRIQHILLSAMSSLTEKRFTARQVTIPTMQRVYIFSRGVLETCRGIRI